MSSRDASYVRVSVTFRLLPVVAPSDAIRFDANPSCVICCSFSSKSEPNSLFESHEALLQTDQDASPTSSGTSKSRRQGLGNVRVGESRSAFGLLVSFGRIRLHEEFVDGVKRRTGRFRRCRECRLPRVHHREGFPRFGNASGRLELEALQYA